jgi:hypothetical protein
MDTNEAVTTIAQKLGEVEREPLKGPAALKL